MDANSIAGALEDRGAAPTSRDDGQVEVEQGEQMHCYQNHKQS